MRAYCFIVLAIGALGAAHAFAADSSPCLFFDLDQDTKVDRTDFDLYQSCITGPALGPVSEPCEPLDVDVDGDIDQADFAAFQACIGRTAVAVLPVISIS